jgi:hypothetical protein
MTHTGLCIDLYGSKLLTACSKRVSHDLKYGLCIRYYAGRRVFVASPNVVIPNDVSPSVVAPPVTMLHN